MNQEKKTIKILFVDDEQIMRDGLQLTIDWQKYGFTVVGGASNGENALALCRNQMPDLVFTDIRMPVMDGLELTKRLVELNPRIKVIILSAYDEFKYAQKAIKYGASEYVLKAELECEDLLSVALKYSEEIIRERSRRSESQEMVQQIRAHTQELQNNLFWKLLTQATHPAEISRQIIDLGITLNEKNIQLLHVCGKTDGILETVLGGEQEYFKNYYCVKSSDIHYIVLCNSAAANQRQIGLERLYAALEAKAGGKISLFHMMVTEGFSSIYQANKSLQQYIQVCLFYEKTGIFCFDSQDGSVAEISLPDILKETMHLISENQMQPLLIYLDGLFGDFKKTFHRPDEIKEAVFVIASLLYERAKTQEKAPYHGTALCISRFTKGTGILLKSHIFHYKSLYDLIEDVMDLCRQLADLIVKHQYCYSSLVNWSIEYIQEHLAQDLRLAVIAREIHCNPAYLSQVFKKETGQNFSDYLTDIRVENAQFLLKTTAMSIGEIAEKVGIPNFSYFSRVFAKSAGMSPKQYRAENARRQVEG